MTTIERIQQIVALSPEYSFLKNNPHLKDKIILLTLGGSYAYGTNIETSDIDIRGCALNSCSDLLGLSNFEQVNSNKTDTTIYSFNKLINLLMSCNPNTIEMLGCKPEHYIYLTPIGLKLISSRKLFLSKKAINSFGGYANQQLHRLENALARDKLPQSKKEEHIIGSMNRAIASFKERYTNFDKGSIELFIDISNNEKLNVEAFANINLNKYPIREFNSILNDLSNIVSSYDKLNQRNKTKDNNHLNKHAMHLVRLYLMCIDILEKEEIITYRENNLDLLKKIRAGEYQKDDGTYKDDFFELVNVLEKRMQYASKNTSLPEKPNLKEIEDFVIEVNRWSIDENRY